MTTPPADRGVPVTLDELADLQDGLLDEQTAADLRARIAADPHADAKLGALALIQAELEDLPPEDLTESEPIPDQVAAALDDAIAAEHARATTQAAADDQTTAQGTRSPRVDTRPATAGPDTGASVHSLAAVRRRRWLAGVGGGIAAAAVIAVVIAGVGLPGSSGPQPGSVPAYGAADLAAAWPDVSTVRDLAALADTDRLDGCLISSGLSGVASSDLLGARPITLDGRPGILLALPAAPQASGPQVTLVVVDPSCSGADPVLARTTTAR